MVSAGVPLVQVAQVLRHHSLQTTALYAVTDLTHKQRAIQRTRPLGSSPVVSNRAMPCSPSWKPSDYADNFRAFTASEQGLPAKVGITLTSA